MEKLKAYFYNQFKNNDFYYISYKLKTVNEREKIIQELSENQEEAYQINADYEKDYKIIYNIFKNNEEAKQPKELKELIKQNEELDEKIEKLKKKLEKEEARKSKIKAGYILGLFAGFKVAGHIAEKEIKKYHGTK